jgi:hypothetical protein
MKEEFELIRELSIGHLIKRQAEISQILKQIDNKSPVHYFDLVMESSRINLEIINFYKDYNTNLSKDIQSKDND